ALNFVSTCLIPVVVKADGLASGKGVVVCATRDEARTAVTSMMVDRVFGEAGKTVVIEECLQGEEVSFLAVSDGNHILPLASSQDHKRVFDNDQGPNTGGMGAYSPAPIVANGMYEKIMDRIMLPAIRGMVTEGRPFTGVLYAGLMVCRGEPFLLEFNVRFGDPETQPLMMRLKNDFVDVLVASVNGTLDHIHLEWDPRPAVCVVMASGGYPGDYEKGKVIRGLADASVLPDVHVFHAGTAKQGTNVVTSGGRVVDVTALGKNYGEAINAAYAAVEKISWDGCHYRKDIGKRALI
ncbi:MAG: phosphoribosylamine--glycine ligase, partial [Deltaproteobacteria bacterium]|nr:phosphoribosylamine--glycine ligase [Deltaproteobacteria bacterium]